MSRSVQKIPNMCGLTSTVRSRWERLTASRIGRDIVLLLGLKVGLVIALYLFVFRPALHPVQDPAATAAAVVGAATAKVTEVQR